MTTRSALSIVFLLALWGCSAPAMPQVQTPETPETPQVDQPEVEQPTVDSLNYKSKGGGKKGATQSTGRCAKLPISLFFNAHEQVNKNERGQPMPVEVRVFLLSDRTAFESLDFDTLWRGAEAALGESLIQTLSAVVYPGKIKIQPMEAPGATTFVALMGLFRQHSGDRWKLVFDVRGLAARCKPGQLHETLRANLYENSLRLDKDMPDEATTDGAAASGSK